MKVMKRRWVKIVGIVLVVALIACFIAFGLFYWRVKHSILEEMGINHMFGVKEICMDQFDSPISDYMSKQA